MRGNRHRIAVRVVVAGVMVTACGVNPALPPADDVVISQAGLPGLTLDREVLSLGILDVERALGGEGSFSLKGQTETCSLGINEQFGVAVMIDTYTAVLGFVVERADVRTAEGIHQGSTIEDIVDTYGQAMVFLAEETSLTGGPLVIVDDIAQPGRNHAGDTLLYGFDTDRSGAVTRLRAGFWPYVGYRDSCSDDANRPEATGWPLQTLGTG